MDAIDTKTLQKISGQLGSNPGGVFQDEQGRRYYVKFLESAAHARNELLAARLYRLAGAPTLTYRKSRAPDEVVTELVHLAKKHIARFSEAERLQAQRWFGVHAWTANWDVAGFGGDNQGIVEGAVVTLDVGGALEFRAQGDPKGKAFGSSVDELLTLRNDPDNPFAVRLFADMNVDALREAMGVVVRIPDEQIRKVVLENGSRAALADKLIARKADMAQRVLALAG